MEGSFVSTIIVSGTILTKISCHDGFEIIFKIAGAVYPGHAAALRILASRDDQVGHLLSDLN